MINNKQKIEIFGIKLDSMSKQSAVQRIIELSNNKTPSLIATINVEFIMRALHNPSFMDILTKKTSLNLIDGSGVIWGYCLLNSWKPQNTFLRKIYIPIQMLFAIVFYPVMSLILCKKYHKISGADIAIDLAKEASVHKKTLFLLGNKLGLDPNAVQKASLELQTNIYDLKIVGVASSTCDAKDKKALTSDIKKSGADILYCGFGSPAQEIWLSENLNRSGAKVGIGLGGTIDFIAGAQKRAPKFIRAIGFEWLYRLIRQPNRIRRQKALIEFVELVYKTRLSVS